MLEEWEPSLFTDDDYGPYELNNQDDDTGKILTTLWWHDQMSDDPDECGAARARTHYLGMVHEDTFTDFNGIATGFIVADQLVVRLESGLAGTGNYNDPLGGRTLAHELGHNYYRYHVDCGDPGWPTDDDYPGDRDVCDLAPVDQTSFFGADLLDIKAADLITSVDVISPTEAGDLMSYRGSRWVSEYTWAGIQHELCKQITGLLFCPWFSPLSAESGTQRASSSQLEAPQEINLSGDVLLIAGLISETVQLDGVHRLAESLVPTGTLEELSLTPQPLQPAASDFALHLLDAGGGVLHTEPFTPTPISDGITPLSMFGLAIPYDASTARIEIVSGTITVATRLVSTNAPTVTVLSPNGGETITDALSVSWMGDDLDGDELSYTVLYSGDQGQTWRALVSDVFTDAITVDSSLLPGSLAESLVRVIANDGVNTGIDQSDAPFSVPPRSPLAFIQHPGAGAVFASGASLNLRGTEYDPEDGQLAGASLSWAMDALGEVGTGREITLNDLAFGSHVVTMTVTDSDGRRTTDTVRFITGAAAQIYLPLVLRLR